MKQTSATIRLRDLMDRPDGWGREEGAEVGTRLRESIATLENAIVFRISLDGITKTDASFPRESVVDAALTFRKRKYFCLVDVANEDLLFNWEAAAKKKEQPIIAWTMTGAMLLGRELTPSHDVVYRRLIEIEGASAAELAESIDTSVPNMSNQLRKLWDDGYILRTERVAPTGGIEYVYEVPK